MPKTRHSRIGAPVAPAAKAIVKAQDKALREHVGKNPTPEAVREAFAQFFPGSTLPERNLQQYVSAVVAGRIYFV